MHPDGGRVRVRGPLGLSRVARTTVVSAERPSLLRGRADVGHSTVGAVRWEIAPAGAGSHVTFTAEVERASPLDRLLLACGGRWWLRRIVDEAVRRLGTSISPR
jgi:Polyketide cyclase / dehydrase and lipid transport